VQQPCRFDIGRLIKTLEVLLCDAIRILSDDEREQIGLAKALGHSIGAIAQAIGRPKSTISRELSRNKLPSGRYSPLHAAGAYQLRRRREALIEGDRALRTFVVDRLAEGWTPEQIAGWLKGGNERRLRAVGCETITPSSIGQPKGPSSCGVISRVVTNAAGHADRELRKIPSRIASPSTNGPRLSTAEPRAAIGRVTSSFVSAHGRCSFSMSANPA
jgi:Helix-turn-helix domain